MAQKGLLKAIVTVPASTANLGPGFDCLGIALNLHNVITVWKGADNAPVPMATAAARAFFQAARCKPFPFSIHVDEKVPRSRGLGSSVTIRLGVIAGLNALCGEKLSPEQILSLVARLEGHPDNAVAAFYGGFAACAATKFVSAPVSPRLKFIALVPDESLETKVARAVLPKQISLGDAVANLQNVSLITAAFVTKNYPALKNLFGDRLHQPYRAALIPGFHEILAAAQRASALGSYLSGAGSTLMALTLGNAKQIERTMLRAARKHRLSCRSLILTADNTGMRLRARLG
jgi:homoserine kinase